LAVTAPLPVSPDLTEASEQVLERLVAGGVEAAREAIADVARQTPVLSSRSLSEACGGHLLLKAENLQRTGSFKLRGALHKIARLGAEAHRGVVAGSAGNHAQSLAYAARARGLPCEVYMPEEAAVAKVAAVEGFGGTVHLGGESVDDCVAFARERASETGAAFVHPFDDADVILGQATLGLELLAEVPDLAKVVVPVGGGGLLSGVAGVLKAARPEIEVVGVQAKACSPFAAALAGEPAPAAAGTIADGIAIKRPGEITLPLVARLLDEMCVVGDEDVAEAIVRLLERAKLVVEGAGAVGVAALLAGAVRPARSGSTVVVLSGGNIDAGLLAIIARRHETAAGRRLRVFTRISDRPGGLAGLLTRVAATGGNLVSVDHVRDAVQLSVRETGVELTLETRGARHSEAILAGLREAGYGVESLDVSR
jgi:threonine dehydratase